MGSLTIDNNDKDSFKTILMMQYNVNLESVIIELLKIT